MSDDWPVWAVLVAVALIIGAVVIEAVGQTHTERFCLAHGYPSAEWRWIGPNYCVKRVNQTDTVVPTAALRP